MGTNNSLATPHEYDLGQLAPGKHTVSIRVDNSMVIDVGENSHCVSDHTQGNWNGVVGRIELRTTPLVWIEELQVYPNAATRSLKVKGRIGNSSGMPGEGQLSVLVIPRFASVTKAAAKQALRISWGRETTEFQTELNLEADDYLEFWSEFKPRAMWTFVANLDRDDLRHVLFGLRDISTDGTQFLINGRKSFFRGTLDCCIFPKTGHPPMEIEEWRRIIRVAKSFGLNLIRFHSWCPPEAAFQAADELGFYFQVETCWPNQSTTLGNGKPVDQWIYDETHRILKAYGNHPSFLLMAAGNEPGGKNANAYLAKYVAHYQAIDPRRLWTSGAGWPELPENQFHVSPDPRVQAWGEGLRSRINARPPETLTDYRAYITQRTVPVISHEIGQWCVYPNFDEIKKYTGYLKPKNFEIFRDTLEAHHMGDLARQFLLASGKLQVLCYKEEIESALRTPGMGGFELLDLHDFPGQGTALVGVLDPFWEEKGYVTAKEFSRFCNSTVPLVRLKKRVFTTDERLEADIEVAHFGAEPLTNAIVVWHLQNDDAHFPARDQFAAQTIPIGKGNSVGILKIDLKQMPAPARYRLVVNVAQPSKKRETPAGAFVNDWDLWVYPPTVDTTVPLGITVVNELSDAAVAALNAGGKVLLRIPPERVAPDKKLGRVALGFSSIFWNTAWTQQQPPHTLGILCDPKHPLFADFPTDSHSNWQWWHLISRAGAMILDDFPPTLRPTVQVIDDWVTARKLGLVVEGKLGGGKLLVCSVDLEGDLAGDPVRRQFRHSLLRYMAGNRFAPKHTVTAEQVRGLIAAPTTLRTRWRPFIQRQ
ncbi:MAG: glycoside hydrolase family 2 TIM barrel-domain containing protein [Verrucomicrobiota bacterium]